VGGDKFQSIANALENGYRATSPFAVAVPGLGLINVRVLVGEMLPTTGRACGGEKFLLLSAGSGVATWGADAPVIKDEAPRDSYSGDQNRRPSQIIPLLMHKFVRMKCGQFKRPSPVCYNRSIN